MSSWDVKGKVAIVTGGGSGTSSHSCVRDLAKGPSQADMTKS